MNLYFFRLILSRRVKVKMNSNEALHLLHWISSLKEATRHIHPNVLDCMWLVLQSFHEIDERALYSLKIEFNARLVLISYSAVLYCCVYANEVVVNRWITQTRYEAKLKPSEIVPHFTALWCQAASA